MKLRNKKTGEIVELKLVQVNDKYLEDHEVDFLNGEKLTLKLLANSFDDVKEPLIKDEKIRKAVRAWAEANNAKRVAIQNNYCLSTEDDEEVEIVFASPIFKGIDDDDFYSIIELCGEEEE